MTTETLASNIRDARHALGWSVEELADKADLEVDLVRKIERGGDCSGPLLLQLSRALGIPPQVLMPTNPRAEEEEPGKSNKWPTIIVTILFFIVAVRTLLASFNH